MRESLQRRRGPWLFSDLRRQRSINGWRCGARQSWLPPHRVQVRARVAVLTTAALMLPTTALAQASPWERAAQNLEQTFTGPLARSLALVAIVIGGLMFMFGEGGAKRQISGIVFGGGLALFAAQFLTWLF